MSHLSTTAVNAVADSKTGVRLAAVILIAAGLLAYANSLGVPFFFDDLPAILENPQIRNLTSLGAVLSPPSDGSGVAGRPLVNLSLAVNYALGGTSPVGYHLANILLHGLGSLALFGLVRRTLLLPTLAGRFGRAALPSAFLSAGLWLLHPLQTESVTCAIQRTELLVGLFYLLTFYAVGRAAENAGPSRLWSTVAVASCFLGMASKEVMVSAPLLVLFFDRAFVTGSFTEAWRRRRALYLGLAASWLLLAFLVVKTGGARGEAAGFGIGITWWAYALKQCEAIILYLKLSAWPNPLVVFYGIDVVTNPAEVWPQAILLLALVVATLWATWRRPMLGFAGLWFFAILAPSSSVVPLVTQTMSEHRMYLPLAAPLVLATVGLHRALGSRAVLVAVVATLAFGVTTRARNHDYRSELTIWTDTVAKVPRNARAHINLGAAHKAAGNAGAALASYEAALRLDPNSPEALNNYATMLIEGGRPADAIEPCRRALRLKPKLAPAHNNLGLALVQTGRAAEALASLQAAISLKPDLAVAHCNLAAAFVALGEPDMAIKHGQRAIRLQPGMEIAHFHLSLAFIRKNQPEHAMAELETILRIRPDHAEARCNLGSLIYRAGDPARAIPHFEAALRSKPAYADAHSNLASALLQTSRSEEAVGHYRVALQLQPENSETHFNLALALLRLGQTTEAIATFETVLRLNPDDARARAEVARLRAPTPAPPR